MTLTGLDQSLYLKGAKLSKKVAEKLAKFQER